MLTSSLPSVSDSLMTESLMWSNICIERIDGALRQLKRLQKAYAGHSRASARHFEKWGNTRPQPTKKEEALRASLDDHLYFFVLTSRQAIKAAWVLQVRGEQILPIRQESHLRAWRDYLEHWDRPARGASSQAQHEKYWQNVSEESAPGLTFGGVGDRLRTVSGVKIRKLRKDLKQARKEAGVVREREWDYCYINAEEAARILGMSLAEFEEMPRKPPHMNFGDDLGVRYWRDWVEARRDGKAIPPGWVPYLGIQPQEES